MDNNTLTAKVLLLAQKKGLTLTIEEKNFLEGVKNGNQAINTN